MTTAVALRNLTGVIDQRLLVNWRVRPEALDALLPPAVVPDLVEGYAIVGVCLVRQRLGVRGVPLRFGSHSSAHRIGVRLADGSPAVFITQRHTGSRLVRLGDRFFPSEHGAATVTETHRGHELSVRFDDARGEVVSVRGAIACELPETSVFGSLTEVSQYFHQASVGYSCGADGRLQGVGFCTDSWKVEPFGVVQARSRLIEGWFGEAEATFDHALIMRDVPATWLSATA